MRLVEKIWLQLKPRKRFEKNAFANMLLTTIEESKNYVQVGFTTEYAELIYWVRDPFKYTKTSIFYYDDYDMEPLVVDDVEGLCDYIYQHMTYKDKHIRYHNNAFHGGDYDHKLFKQGVPYIAPRPR